MQQTLPQGRCRLRVSSFEAPRFRVVGITEITVTISQIVIPHGACHQFATSAIGIEFFFVEIGTSFIPVRIEAQLGMNEIVNERGDINIACIAPLRISKVGRLDGLLHRIHKLLDVGELLGLQFFLLRIDARPCNLTRHDALSYTGNCRRKGRILFVVRIDAEDVATRHVAPFHITLFQFGNVHTLFAPLDGFRQDVDSPIFTIQSEFHHACARCPMAHVAPKLEGQRVADGRHIVIRGKQHPIAMGRHTQQWSIQLVAILIAQLDGIFLLIEGE